MTPREDELTPQPLTPRSSKEYERMHLDLLERSALETAPRSLTPRTQGPHVPQHSAQECRGGSTTGLHKDQQCQQCQQCAQEHGSRSKEHFGDTALDNSKGRGGCTAAHSKDSVLCAAEEKLPSVRHIGAQESTAAAPKARVNSRSYLKENI